MQIDLGLHCLHRPVCVKIWDHYSKLLKKVLAAPHFHLSLQGGAKTGLDNVTEWSIMGQPWGYHTHTHTKRHMVNLNAWIGQVN